MDWNVGFVGLLFAAFGIGALHALEPGHGKSIMGAYIVASRGKARHALLLGVVVTVTHTIVVFLLAIAALVWAEKAATERVTFWLKIISGALVLAVGIWMLLRSFGIVKRAEHAHPHDHADASHQHHEHHGHTHAVEIPEGRDPLGFWTLIAVGTSGGLVPCPAALTALLAAVNMGRPAAGIAVVAAMGLGIATTLVAIGILFVQAGKWASRLFGSHVIGTYVPRISAVVITVLGLVLVIRAFHGHAPQG